MEPTQQPIAFDTQGNLIIPGVHSDNYVTGVSGWTINKDGSAEFNNVVIRNGSTVGGEAFFYSGTPALGNLIASISATTGNDPFGNPYVSGIVSYSSSQSRIQMANGLLLIGKIGDTANQQGIMFQATKTTTETGTNLCTVQYAPLKSAGAIDRCVVYITEGTGATQATSPYALITSDDTNGIYLRVSGTVLKCDPATDNAYQWQTPTYNTNWQASTTFNTLTGYDSLQFRLDAEDNLVMSGAFMAGAVVPGATVFNLPAGYRPVSGSKLIFCQRNNAGALSMGHALITTGGNVNLFAAAGIGIAANNEYVLNGVVPLKKIA